MKYRKTAAIGFVFVCLLGIVFLLPRQTADERALSQEIIAKISSLSAGQTLELSAIKILKNVDQVCLIDSYAIRVGDRQEESLRRIFGDIDYELFRNEIVARYTGEDRPGLYLVTRGSVTKSLRLILPPRTYLKPEKLQESTGQRYYTLSSCHKPSDVCLRKAGNDDHGDHPIIVNLCTESERNLKND